MRRYNQRLLFIMNRVLSPGSICEETRGYGPDSVRNSDPYLRSLVLCRLLHGDVRRSQGKGYSLQTF